MLMIMDVTRQVRRFLKRRLPTGIDRVALAYMARYGQQSCALVRWAGRSWILPLQHSLALFHWLANPQDNMTCWRILLRGMASGLTVALPNQTILMVVSQTGDKQHADHLRLKQRYGTKLVYFVHDLIPVLNPEFCSQGEDMRHQAKMNHVLTHAAGIITNSKETLTELGKYAARMHQMLPIAVSARLAGIQTEKNTQDTVSFFNKPQKPYFVIVGTIEPRKNHWLLLQVWRELVALMGHDTPHLVVIGQKGWECDHILNYISRCATLKEVIWFKSNCQDAEVAAYVKYSQALLFPTFAEGYGLPLIEALSQGVPVIASDLTVFKEIAGDSIEYASPIDGRRWLELVMAYASNQHPQRNKQMDRIKAYIPPTWEDHFIIIEHMLHNLLKLDLK